MNKKNQPNKTPHTLSVGTCRVHPDFVDSNQHFVPRHTDFRTGQNLQ